MYSERSTEMEIYPTFVEIFYLKLTLDFSAEMLVEYRWIVQNFKVCKTPDDLVPFNLSFCSTQEKKRRPSYFLNVFISSHHCVQFCHAHRNP